VISPTDIFQHSPAPHFKTFHRESTKKKAINDFAFHKNRELKVIINFIAQTNVYSHLTYLLSDLWNIW
jgi:hypothetical protein